VAGDAGPRGSHALRAFGQGARVPHRLLCQPKVAGESTALLGFGMTFVEGERTGEVLTFRSGRLH
jgi:hypothetical protein